MGAGCRGDVWSCGADGHGCVLHCVCVAIICGCQPRAKCSYLERAPAKSLVCIQLGLSVYMCVLVTSFSSSSKCPFKYIGAALAIYLGIVATPTVRN